MISSSNCLQGGMFFAQRQQNDGGLFRPRQQRIDAPHRGQVKASSIKKVADFVDSHPEESTAILRARMHETRMGARLSQRGGRNDAQS